MEELQKINTNKNKIETVITESNEKTGKNIQKILILTDECGRDLDKELRRRYKQENIQIQALIKPGAMLSGVTEDLENVTKNLSSNDYVIVIAGTNDLLQLKYPSMRVINSKLNICSNTNFIFLSTFKTSKINYSSTANFNIRLNQYINTVDIYNEYNISYLNICNNKGYKLNNFNISWLIKKQISLTKTHTSLIFVKMNEENSKEHSIKMRHIIITSLIR